MAVEDAENCDPENRHLFDRSEDETDNGQHPDCRKEELRYSWSRRSEYILSLMGYSVGLGNIWRFPYVCMRNGGGAFLIPFFVSLISCALPVYLLETVLGQFLGKGAWHAWSICPLFKGLGISMNLLCIFVAWYYGMILAWCCIYLVHSFRSPLPWTLCNQPWNTPGCIETSDMALHVTNSSYPLSNVTLPYSGRPLVHTGNQSQIVDEGLKVNTASNEFWLNNVLEISTGLDDVGGLPWHTALALVVANFVCLIAICNGVKSSGKVVYVTATLPYILLTAILIVGVIQPGAADGILYYISPNFSKLTDINTWVEAFIQIFYSLGTTIGCLITMASYNKFNYNCVRDSVALVLVCEGTSLFGGFAIFSILGHMSYKAKIPIEDFAKSGAGLAFIVYPEAVSYLPLPQLWAVMFFLMLFSLGLDSQFVHFETVVTSLADAKPRFTARWRKYLTFATVALTTVLGFVFATRGGMYLFQLVDWYFAAFTLLIQAMLECVIVAWIYGADRFSRDIALMTGRKLPYVFVICWKFISPGLLLVMFIITLVCYKPLQYEGYRYSALAEIFGWIFAIIPFFSVIAFAFWKIMRAKGSLRKRVRSLCVPGAQWQPNDPIARGKYQWMVVEDRESKLYEQDKSSTV